MSQFQTKWIKLDINTFEDEKIKLIEGMPSVGESIENVWIKLLCLAGKVNDNGYIYFSKMYDEEYNPEMNNGGYVKGYSEEQLAIIFNKPLDIIKLSMKTFIELEMIIIDQFGVIFLQNFYKYQSIEKLNYMKSERTKKIELIQKKIDNGESISKEEKEIVAKEKTRIRVQRYRERQKREEQNISALNSGVTGGYNVTQCNGQDEKKHIVMENESVTQGVTLECYKNDDIVEKSSKNTGYEPLQEALPKSLQTPLQMPIDIDKDIDIDEEKDKESEKDIRKEEREKRMKMKNKKSDYEYIQEKLEEVIGKTSDDVQKECFAYLKSLSLEVILYAITITKKARNPCWKYTQKVLESYKSKELYSLDLLLDYLDKKEKNILKPGYSFMEDIHTSDEWEELYDN